jgi:hypothetical protein
MRWCERLRTRSHLLFYDHGEALNKPGLMSRMSATALTVIFGHDSPSTAKKPA